MAHRYLGEPFDIHGGGADLDLPAPRERDRPVRRGVRRRPVRAPLDPLGDGELRRREDVEVARQLRDHPQGRARPTTSRRCACTSSASTTAARWRSPSPTTTRGTPAIPEIDEAEARLAYYYRTLERLAAAPGEDDGGAVVPPADKTISAFREAMDDDFNTAAAIGHLSDAFLLANKLLDEPGGGGQGRPAPDAGAAAQGSRRLRRDAGDLPAAAVRVPGCLPPAAVRAPRNRSGGHRGAHRRARRRPQSQGLRPRR